MQELKTIKETILKRYDSFDFPENMREGFLALLEREELPDGINAESADLSKAAGEKSTLTALYLCEEMEREFKNRGIHRLFESHVLTIKKKIETTYKNKGNFDLGDMEWNRKLFQAKLLRLGRLQFGLGTSPVDIDSLSVKKGDNVLQLHIPAGEKLGFDACIESINTALALVEKNYTDFEYRYITCLSWLLDDSVDDLLGEGSNVIKFRTLFTVVANGKSDSIIRFVFGGGATRETLPSVTPNGRFQTELKEEALRGREFYCPRGVIDTLEWKRSDYYKEVSL